MAEDDAPRLAAAFPSLCSARIEVIEQVPNANTRYVKHIVVARSPALFLIPCGDAICQHGGHDITTEIMNAFRRQLTSAAGEKHCEGTTGSAPCRRAIQFALTAEYR